MFQQKRKFSLKYLQFLILSSGLFLILTLPEHARAEGSGLMQRVQKQVPKDTIKPIVKDTTGKKGKIDTLSLKISRDSISFPVEHKCHQQFSNRHHHAVSQQNSQNFVSKPNDLQRPYLPLKNHPSFYSTSLYPIINLYSQQPKQQQW
jgi:hypothetical protein